MKEQAESLLAALRAGGAEAERARAALAHAGPAPQRDERERLRAAVAQALARTLRPGDHPAARWLLQQEVAAHEARGAGASETLYTLVAATARFGQASDAPLIFRARQATPETRAGVDVEQLGRADIAETRTLLRSLAAQRGAEGERAAQALGWLEDGAAAGALDDLPGYFLWADERFGLSVSGPT